MEERVVGKEIVKDMISFIAGIPACESGGFASSKGFAGHPTSNRETCVGPAANMIGVQKEWLFLISAWFPWLCFNPILKSLEGPYEIRGRMFVSDGWDTTRYEKLPYPIEMFIERTEFITLTGFPAQICQHELDHLGRITRAQILGAPENMPHSRLWNSNPNCKEMNTKCS